MKESTVAVLLDCYARELDCYTRARDGMRPLSLRLVAALRQYLEHPWDGELLGQARALRAQHAARAALHKGTLDAWAASRGADDALWTMVAAMTPAETERFDLLVGRGA